MACICNCTANKITKSQKPFKCNRNSPQKLTSLLRTTNVANLNCWHVNPFKYDIKWCDKNKKWCNHLVDVNGYIDVPYKAQRVFTMWLPTFTNPTIIYISSSSVSWGPTAWVYLQEDIKFDFHTYVRNSEISYFKFATEILGEYTFQIRST